MEDGQGQKAQREGMKLREREKGKEPGQNGLEKGGKNKER